MGKYKVAKGEAEAVSIKLHKTFKKNFEPYLFIFSKACLLCLSPSPC